MKKLLIDTSSDALIILLFHDFEVIDYVFKMVKRDHSSVLMPNIDNLLIRNKLKIKEIDEVIVGYGPGSYTGVRIGVTVAKTLSYALKIPLKKVSSLQIMSASLIDKAKYIAPMIDARRGNVFSSLYKVENNKLQVVLEDKLYPFLSFHDEVLRLTNNENLYYISINQFVDMDVNFVLLDDVFNPQLFKYLDFIQVDNIHPFVPNYLRKTEAEMKLHG